MRNIVLTFVMLLSNTVCGQIEVAEILQSRTEYVETVIPQSFKHYYKNYLMVEDSLIELLIEKAESDYLLWKVDTLIFIESNIIQEGLILGCLTSADASLAYEIDLIKKSITFISSKQLPSLLAFSENVKKWDQNVVDRSYIGSTIAGGGYLLCSRVTNSECKNIAFAEYDKNSKLIYLREFEKNNWAPRRVFLE